MNHDFNVSMRDISGTSIHKWKLEHILCKFLVSVSVVLATKNSAGCPKNLICSFWDQVSVAHINFMTDISGQSAYLDDRRTVVSSRAITNLFFVIGCYPSNKLNVDFSILPSVEIFTNFWGGCRSFYRSSGFAVQDIASLHVVVAVPSNIRFDL